MGRSAIWGGVPVGDGVSGFTSKKATKLRPQLAPPVPTGTPTGTTSTSHLPHYFKSNIRETWRVILVSKLTYS
ncbi:hypothetical protein DW790_08230 [Firmicutes bacterium AM31-12AC]|nr:hypothetical protein DW790_08230 [Firmicutes bacterium AM31-12AC]